MRLKNQQHQPLVGLFVIAEPQRCTKIENNWWKTKTGAHKNIKKGEEMNYDYGERRSAVIKELPWLGKDNHDNRECS